MQEATVVSGMLKSKHPAEAKKRQGGNCCMTTETMMGLGGCSLLAPLQAILLMYTCVSSLLTAFVSNFLFCRSLFNHILYIAGFPCPLMRGRQAPSERV